MRYGETGVNLEVDLSRGNIEKETTDPEITKLHLGGLGTNTKILWDRVPPETDPLSPENVLVFGTGILTGTAAPSANRTIISSFSPQTNLMAYSMMGGFWAPELKNAGYDKVIIRGRSPELVYLWINNDKVEIRDASHLKGKGAQETAELIREELNEPRAQVAAIGMAGENRVYFASIEHGRSSAARLGLGAVMGDKGLKAIAVRGTKDVNIGRPEEYYKLCTDLMKQILYRRDNPPQGILPWFTVIGLTEMEMHDESFHTDNFAWGNARERRKGYWNKEREEEWGAIQDNTIERFIGCYNCPLKCGAIMLHSKLKRYMMKCFSKVTYTMGAMSDDMAFGFDIAGLAQEYGVDAYSTPQVMAFAVELYEAGILTDEDMPGFPSDNEERFYWLLEKIVRREGIGDILADGVYWAARKIGKGAEAYDHNTIKKHEQVPNKLSMLDPIFYLMLATGEKMNITSMTAGVPQMPIFDKELREEFVKDWVVPREEIKQFVRDWGEPDTLFPYFPSAETACILVDWEEALHYIDNCTGLCTALSARVLKSPINMSNIPQLISCATGVDFDEEEVWEITRRNRNLLRAINVRRGLRRVDERPPEDHWKKRFPEYEAQLLDDYYKLKGWNNDGIPTKETLHDLGLDYVAEDMEKRGIYEQ